MCGITGFIEQRPVSGAEGLAAAIGPMMDALVHRGPDDSGWWVDEKDGVALGHRRLSIIDLSPQGRQPMISTSRRYAIVYNGEVYNFMDLRQKLEKRGHRFRGHSDTEVILAACEEWGLVSALSRFIGMFAFALLDLKEKKVHLVRDRLGIKPLYYGWAGDVFLFGSELKALRRHPAWEGEIDRNVLALLLRYAYIPAPWSIHRGIYKLAPGSLLTVGLGSGQPADFSPFARRDEPEARKCPYTYWSLKDVVEHGFRRPFEGDEDEAARQLEAILGQAVTDRMISDVPLGAFLSGGIDSSLIVALMQASTSRPVKTFGIGFFDDAYNEAPYAKEVADHLQTDHTELYVTPEMTLNVIEKLATIYDEPFADSSQIPTFLLSKLTGDHVTVSLSGDGGDEVFGGYRRYFLAPNLWQKFSKLPMPVRRLSNLALKAFPARYYRQAVSLAGPVLPKSLKSRDPVDSLYKIADLMDSNSLDEFYRTLISHWKNPEVLVPGSKEPPIPITMPEWDPKADDFIRRIQYFDLLGYHPDDILVKVDRASMAVGLEARVPFIDHRVVEFAATLPAEMLVKNGQGKYILRKVLDKYVPRSLMDRPKKGFSLPTSAWLRGPLVEWAEDLLSESKLGKEGFFEPKIVRQAWKEHLAGRHDWKNHLWIILMFEQWLDSQVQA